MAANWAFLTMKNGDRAKIPYRPDIDGLRALAIALVLAFHVAPTYFPAGFLGVDVFFVLSGFLITRILVADHGEKRLRRFYARRVRRLAPALVLVLAATLALGYWTLLGAAFEQLAQHVAAAALFVANIVFWSQSGYFDASAIEKPLLHLWSLGIEEQFYLFWPVTLFVLIQKPRRALVITSGLAIASYVACCLVVRESPNAAFYLPWFRFWEPLAGAVLALTFDWENANSIGPSSAAPGQETQNSLRAEFLAWSGLTLVCVSVLGLRPGASFPSWTALAPVAGTVMLLAAGGSTTLARSVLSLRPVVGLGKISYPLYLWHWPLISLVADSHPVQGIASRAWACVVATLLASLTYLLVERPVRRSQHRWPRSTVWGWVGAMVLLVALALGPLSRQRAENIPTNPRMARVEEAIVLDAQLRADSGSRACENLGQPADEREFFCQVSGELSVNRPILLWGDSTAESWAPLIHAVASDQGKSAVAVSFSGCPPLLGVRAPLHENCTVEDSSWKKEMIERFQPSHIVVTARWGSYINKTTGNARADLHYVSTEPKGPVDRATSRQAVTERLPETLDWLTSLAPTTVIEAPPDLLNELRRSVLLSLEHEPLRVDHYESQQLITELVAAVAARQPRLNTIDPALRLCGGERCAGILEDTFVYLDDNHVSAQGALLFRDMLMAAVEEASQRQPVLPYGSQNVLPQAPNSP